MSCGTSRYTETFAFQTRTVSFVDREHLQGFVLMKRQRELAFYLSLCWELYPGAREFPRTERKKGFHA